MSVSKIQTAADLARELGANRSTVKRAISDGTIHCARVSSRRIEIASDEVDLLKRTWPLIANLRRIVKTERQLSTVVLHGSMATGAFNASSDIDLIVSFKNDHSTFDVLDLKSRLERALDCSVDIAVLNNVVADQNVLLRAALLDGRVITDRQNQWVGLLADFDSISDSADIEMKALETKSPSTDPSV